MSENFNNNDLQNDAQIKIEKLREIADDILKNGVAGGDHTARSFVITALTKSDNEILHNKLEEILFDKNEEEIIKTIICGLFLQKKIYAPLIKYANNILPKTLILDKEFEGKESLILVLDALVNATDSDDVDIREKALDSLINLYIASCSQHSTALIADQLLQRCINILSKRNDCINYRLLDLIKEPQASLNCKLVAIDILGRSKFKDFYPLLEELILNMQNFTTDDAERLHLLDVSTKALSYYAASANGNKLRDLLKELNMLDFVVKEPNDYAEAIYRRIKSRLKNLNDSLNSTN